MSKKTSNKKKTCKSTTPSNRLRKLAKSYLKCLRHPHLGRPQSQRNDQQRSQPAKQKVDRHQVGGRYHVAKMPAVSWLTSDHVSQGDGRQISATRCPMPGSCHETPQVPTSAAVRWLAARCPPSIACMCALESDNLSSRNSRFLGGRAVFECVGVEGLKEMPCRQVALG